VNFVLDTNALSELRKAQPNSGFLDWITSQDPADLFITTITVAEVWHGFYSLPPNHADYGNIKRFASNLPRVYGLLKFDLRAAEVWGGTHRKGERATAITRFLHCCHCLFSGL